jgi:hypothetical protein
VAGGGGVGDRAGGGARVRGGVWTCFAFPKALPVEFVRRWPRELPAPPRPTAAAGASFGGVVAGVSRWHERLDRAIYIDVALVIR